MSTVQWDHIFSFIKERWGLTKKEVAQKLNMQPSAFSRSKNPTFNNTDIENIYKNFFQLKGSANMVNSIASENHEKDSKLIEAIIRHLESKDCKEDAAITQEFYRQKGYTEAILDLLWRANKPSIREKSKKSPKENDPKSPQTNLIQSIDIKTDSVSDTGNQFTPPTKPDFKTYLQNKHIAVLNSDDSTPADQMRAIFDAAMSYYNIVQYIMKLKDYLYGEDLYAGDIGEFNDALRIEILSPFINYQNEAIYKNIAKFTEALISYASFLPFVPSSLSEEYGFDWICGSSHDDIMNKIELHIEALLDQKQRLPSTPEIEVPSSPKIYVQWRECNLLGQEVEDSEQLLTPSIIDEKIQKLRFLETSFAYHKDLCRLYSEICERQMPLIR